MKITRYIYSVSLMFQFTYPFNALCIVSNMTLTINDLQNVLEALYSASSILDWH